jgi:large repetitive protein
VSFFDGGNLIGTGTVDATGVAKLTTTTLPIGIHAITASYAGDGNFTGSDNTAAPLSQAVNKSDTKARLALSTTQAKMPLTLTTTIVALAPGGGVPTGSVTFKIDGIERGTVSLSNGVATLVLPNGLAQGTHTIVVKYTGDANFLASNTGFTYDFGGRGT